MIPGGLCPPRASFAPGPACSGIMPAAPAACPSGRGDIPAQAPAGGTIHGNPVPAPTPGPARRRNGSPPPRAAPPGGPREGQTGGDTPLLRRHCSGDDRTWRATGRGRRDRRPRGRPGRARIPLFGQTALAYPQPLRSLLLPGFIHSSLLIAVVRSTLVQPGGAGPPRPRGPARAAAAPVPVTAGRRPPPLTPEVPPCPCRPASTRAGW